MPLSKILLWGGFGMAVRFWQLAIEMRPFFFHGGWPGYPIYGAIGAGFGYYLMGVEERQQMTLQQKRDALLEKRRRRAQREGNSETGGVLGAVESVKEAVLPTEKSQEST